jgi:predicted XRE-type DNA-binding protein
MRSEIRRLWDSREMSQAAIGRKFGINSGRVNVIIKRKAWAHVA